uniref:Tudor domain-containing protein n=1 Tax=Rhabditophanes sp. KR3021 TaxID=114890 RepID=A0AC35U0W3_9BILA
MNILEIAPNLSEDLFWKQYCTNLDPEAAKKLDQKNASCAVDFKTGFGQSQENTIIDPFDEALNDELEDDPFDFIYNSVNEVNPSNSEYENTSNDYEKSCVIHEKPSIDPEKPTIKHQEPWTDSLKPSINYDAVLEDIQRELEKEELIKSRSYKPFEPLFIEKPIEDQKIDEEQMSEYDFDNTGVDDEFALGIRKPAAEYRRIRECKSLVSTIIPNEKYEYRDIKRVENVFEYENKCYVKFVHREKDLCVIELEQFPLKAFAYIESWKRHDEEILKYSYQEWQATQKGVKRKRASRK